MVLKLDHGEHLVVRQLHGEDGDGVYLHSSEDGVLEVEMGHNAKVVSQPPTTNSEKPPCGRCAQSRALCGECKWGAPDCFCTE